MTSLLKFGVCAAIALCAIASQAQDKKADPNGTWKWSGPAGRNGGTPPEISLKLKAEGAKLTGTLTTPGRQGGAPTDVQISDGKVDGDKISFAVVRDFNGTSITNKYEGKIAGDTITGTQPAGRGGRGRRNGAGADAGGAATPAAPTTQPWEAKRSK